jgi:hypothetical protein
VKGIFYFFIEENFFFVHTTVLSLKTITSSVRGEQSSQLSSIMPPHSTSRLQLMPPTQNSSSSTSLVQMRAKLYNYNINILHNKTTGL